MLQKGFNFRWIRNLDVQTGSGSGTLVHSTQVLSYIVSHICAPVRTVIHELDARINIITR